MEFQLPLLFPGYQLIGWRVVEEGSTHRVYRPGAGRLARRLVLMVLLLGLSVWLLYARSKLLETAGLSFSGTVSASHLPLGSGASEAELEVSRERHERRGSQAIAEFRARQQMLGSVCAVASIVLAVTSLLVFLPLFLSRVSMQQDRGALLIRDGVLGRRKRLWSTDDYAFIQYGAEERAIRNRRRIVGSYWVWFVRLCPNVKRGALSGPSVAFYPLQSAERPGAQPRPPAEVRGLIQFLYTCTRLPVEGPLWAELGVLPNGHVGTMLTHTVDIEPVKVRRTERSIPVDETPEVLRSLAARGMSLRRVTHDGEITYLLEDSVGREFLYKSPGEMPPEHRAFYEMILKFEEQHR